MTMLTTSLVAPDESAPILDLSIGDLLRRVAAEVPDRTALVSVAPEREPRTWTYAELLSDAEHAAQWLLERFEPGEHIAVWAPNVPEWVVLQHGAALAGLVLVTANPALRGAELAYLLDQSDSVGIAYAAGFRGTDMGAILNEVLPQLKGVREQIPFEGWLDQIRDNHSDDRDLPTVDPGSAAQLQYTSGTTGFPKGARLGHRAMLTNASYIHRRAQSSEATVWVSAMPLFHTAGCGMAGLGTITQRGTLVLCELFDPTLVLDSIVTWGADHYLGVPAMLRGLLAHPDFDSYDFSRLEVVLSGGDTVPPDVVTAVEDRFGVRFTTVYGQTELSPIIAQTSPDDSTDDKCHTVGRPLWNVEIAVLDPLTGEVVALGEVGEICARGYQQMLGYYNMPDQTAETIDADGWLHTGDLGTLDERGYLRVTGRLKDMVIRGGENIYPREVEDVLIQHEAIATAIVVGVPDERWGESVAAVVSLSSDVTPTGQELHDFVRTHLAPHKTPKAWYVADELPTNAMGKLQKFRLRESIVSGELAPLPQD
ncbi:long-chain fatty acid--CoA ligase [Aeromicrobium sp. PE09-221]|uniref:AMP-binding protein n=1 Tax=Aeromicrobium sp. PE09-221 TaxID=1898043 RepID=UPI000B3E5D62|nr:AMP-binding protein [Aeromicrobium sp. PE09-221]OUZ12402.1 long-chain fatty acid--CoA ligase [Aeromicrobium sp. PE09-221]